VLVNFSVSSAIVLFRSFEVFRISTPCASAMGWRSFF